ncbi:MAG: RES domain-containing protein, partial [Flavobacterium sp.]
MEPEKPKLTQREEGIRKKIQSQIKYCDYDQPYDGGDVVWIYGIKTDLYDLLSEHEIGEESKEKIVEHLFCPGCGNSTFDLMSNVGLETDYERELDEHFEKASKLFKKEVSVFENELETYPMLAMQNKLAKKIYSEIEQSKLPITDVSGNFFRARRVQSSEIYEADKMLQPPIGKPTEGRFNHAGQSHLYLANNKETAIKEVIYGDRGIVVWVQKFTVLRPIDKILDLTFDWTNLSTSTQTLMIALNIKDSLIKKDRNVENWKPDYYITRFLMDCAKKSGYNGIKYNSAHGYSEYNVVIFDSKSIDIVPKGNPKIKIFFSKDQKDNLPDIS